MRHETGGNDEGDPQAPALGEKIIGRLTKGELPQMVDWFDPGLLAKVGVRSVISATLGAYTDQRLIQAATDEIAPADLKKRYDYSETSENPGHAIEPDATGAVWVDYIADLGDGFESTYAMAYLLAADELKARGETKPLPAGKLLIMGGDQVYPDATKQEYHARLRDPYDWAFPPDHTPRRKLFAIPGNHDWYDGLSAFSALFCSARDRISRGKGVQIGGWRCYQHRSYFAIKLPFNWWIWGPDIQLADNLDDSQRDYFDLMSERATAGHKIILCLAEPSWLHKNYDNLHEISMLARQHGAEICAVIAGDWHHYSRYYSDQLGIQFITCGGGGAFAHATHGLKKRIALSWARRTGRTRIASPEDTAEFNRLEKTVIAPGGTDFTRTREDAAATEPSAAPSSTAKPAPEEPAAEPKPITDTDAGPHGFGSRLKRISKDEIEHQSAAYDCRVQKIYPPQWKSRLLSMKNLGLPFRNRGFTALVGLIYFLYAWVYVAADPRQSPVMRKLKDAIASEAVTVSQTATYIEDRIKELQTQKEALATGAGDAAGKSAAEIDTEIEAARETLKGTGVELEGIQRRQMALMDEDEKKTYQAFIDSIDATANDASLSPLAKIGALMKATISYSMSDVLNTKALVAASEQSPFFAFLLLGLWAGLVFYVETESKLGKLIIGSAHFAAHLWALLVISWIATSTAGSVKALGLSWLGLSEASVIGDVIRIGWNLLLTFFVGGALGGLVMGIYWTLTSALLNMHTGDAFGALGIRHYKHFLRIKLEKDRATIYPIAIDKVPGRFGWRWKLYPGETKPSHNPQIMPKDPLEPRLIEPPIMVDLSKVSE